jgi:hypothetical protein
MGANSVHRNRVWNSKAAICFVALLLASTAWSERETSTSGRALTASRFQAISRADLEKTGSGCSFAAFRGKELIAVSFSEEDLAGKPQFWFKIDGTLAKVAGEARKSAKTQSMGVWSGKVAGSVLRITEGRIDPNFKNDGGSIGGAGRISWKGAGQGSAMPIRWEAGC